MLFFTPQMRAERNNVACVSTTIRASEVLTFLSIVSNRVISLLMDRYDADIHAVGLKNHEYRSKIMRFQSI